jgi:hypothetical protein
MLSFSRIKLWLNGKQTNATYSESDRFVNEIASVIDNEGYTSEVQVENEHYHGYLDFAKKDSKGKVIEFIECKARSKVAFDKWVVLQVYIYETITKCKNWTIRILDRTKEYKPTDFCRDYVIKAKPKMWDFAQKTINFIEAHYNEVDYECAKEKVDYE